MNGGPSLLYQACGDEVGALFALVIRNGLLNCLQYLITSAVDINEPYEGQSPLMLAADVGKLECARVLLAKGANIDWRDQNGESALFKAAANRNFEIADFLLDQGADASGRGLGKRNLIQLCVASPQTLRKALKRFPEPNLRDDGGLAPIHYAVSSPQAEVIKILAEFGADVNATTSGKEGEATPLILATCIGQKNLDIIQCLLHAGADVNYQDNKKCSALHFAPTAKVVAVLLQRGAEVNMADIHRDTVLHYQVRTFSHDLSIIEKLVNAGADVNAKNIYNHTPLWYLVERNHLFLIDYFLSKGADPNIANPWYGSSLHFACSLGNTRVVKMLHAAGAKADLKASDLYGTPLQAACLSDSRDRDVLEVMQYLVEKAKASVNQICGLYGTAVHAACRRSSSRALEQLACTYRAEVRVPDDVGRLSIHLAASTEFGSFQFLIELTCDFHSTDKTGRNVLHWAAQSGNARAVSLILLQPGIAIDAVDKDGWTALCWAARGLTHRLPSNRDAQADIIELLLGKRPVIR